MDGKILDEIISSPTVIVSELKPPKGNMKIRDLPPKEFFKTEKVNTIFQIGPWIQTNLHSDHKDNTLRLAYNLRTGEKFFIAGSQRIERHFLDPKKDLDLIPFIVGD